MTSAKGPLVRWAAAGLYHARLLGPLSRAAGVAARPPAFQILTYHRVNDEDDPFFEAIPTGVFASHMRYVASTHAVLPVDELAERARRGTLPRNALAITFDDGYRDNLTQAAPVLQRLRLPATVFLATGLIGTGKTSWFDQLALAFKLTRAGEWQTPWGRPLTLGSTGDRLAALGACLAHLKSQPDLEQQRLRDEIVAALGAPDEGALAALMLTWKDVHALVASGFTVGAHTVNHPILSRVSAERARREIEDSRDAIASACGRRPFAFAYPNGTAADYTETVKTMVREAGFTCAVTTRFGLNTARTSPFELRRGGPWEQDLPTFALKLTGYRLVGAGA